VNAFASPGGVKPFIRFSVAGLNGSCGAISGAKTAERIRSAVTAAEIIATGERRNAWATSLSQAMAMRERARSACTVLSACRSCRFPSIRSRGSIAT
jgi:hypothetical protein